MAEEVEDASVEEDAPKSKKKIIIIVAIAIILAAAAAGGTLFFLSGDDAEEGDVAVEEAVVEEQVERAIYFPISSPFIVNFSSRGKRHLLQATLTIMTRDPLVLDSLQDHLPLIKHDLGLIISGEVYEDLQTDEGRELLRQRLADRLNLILRQEVEGETGGVEQVLFENFVMQ